MGSSFGAAPTTAEPRNTAQSSTSQNAQSGDSNGDFSADVSLRRLSLGSIIKHESEETLVHSTYDQNSTRIQEMFNEIVSKTTAAINDPNTPSEADQHDCEIINSDGPFPRPMLANVDGFIKFENDTISGNYPFIMTVSW